MVHLITLQPAHVAQIPTTALSRQSPVGLRRLAEFLPRTDRETLLDADRAARQVIVMHLTLEWIRRLRDQLSPENEEGIRWLPPDIPLVTIDEEIMRYLMFKQVLPLQLMLDKGLPLRTLYHDAVGGAPVVWLGHMSHWHHFVGRQVSIRVDMEVPCCKLCLNGGTPMTVMQTTVEHPDNSGRTTRYQFIPPSGRPQSKKVDSAGRTAAHIAASLGHEYCLRVAHTLGVDLQQADHAGTTAVHLAAMNGHDACLRFLDSVGVPMTAADGRGETPMGLASARGHDSCVRFLRDVNPPLLRADQ